MKRSEWASLLGSNPNVKADHFLEKNLLETSNVGNIGLLTLTIKEIEDFLLSINLKSKGNKEELITKALLANPLQFSDLVKNQKIVICSKKGLRACWEIMFGVEVEYAAT